MKENKCPICGCPLSGFEMQCPECEHPLLPEENPSSTPEELSQTQKHEEPAGENISNPPKYENRMQQSFPQESLTPPPSTPPQETPDFNYNTEKKNNKKWIIVGNLFALVTVFTTWSIISYYRENQRQAEYLQKQNATRDSLRMVEEQRQEALRLEQARLDSIRQDSIQKEENMRIKPYQFKYAELDEKLLKKLGFKKIKEKYTPYEEDEGLGLYELVYTRTFNGRKIDIEYVSESCHGVNLVFYDKSDLNLFIEELENLGYKNDDMDYWKSINKYYFDFRIDGNIIEITGCG